MAQITTEQLPEPATEATPETLPEVQPEVIPPTPETPPKKPINRNKLLGGLLAGGLLLLLSLFSTFAAVKWLPAGKPYSKRPDPEDPTLTTLVYEGYIPELTLPDNPYGAEDFALDGSYLTCLSGDSILGIDVSTYQKNVNWQKVKEAGVEFVIIRVGFRGWGSAGTMLPDSMAQSHYAGAKAAGLKVGAYFFSQCTTVPEAQEEAEFALSLIKDWELDLPLVFDWEYISDEARTASVERQMLTDCAYAFCLTAEEGGVPAMVYFNPSMVKNRIHLEQLSDFPFWLAHYTTEMSFPYKVDMWQYTSQGRVPGISGYVDINLYFPYDN